MIAIIRGHWPFDSHASCLSMMFAIAALGSITSKCLDSHLLELLTDIPDMRAAAIAKFILGSG